MGVSVRTRRLERGMQQKDYDPDKNLIVDNAEKLEGSTKAQVRDHTPKAHAHNLSELADVNDYNLGPNKILKYDGSEHIYVPIPIRTPDYDSGWFAVTQNSNTVKTHDLGTTDLLIDIQGKDTVGEINQKHVGGDIQWDNDLSIYVSHGAYWHYLSPTTVLIHRNAEDINWAQIRVRIWKI